MKKEKAVVKNQARFIIPSYSRNEAFARTAAALFASALDPTVEELSDIKAAVSEAVTNCIVHAYKDVIGVIDITLRIMSDNTVYIRVRDKGCGIADIQRAMTPMFTTCAEGERAGLGFAVMESFMDKLKVYSKEGNGTTVTMSKRLKTKDE